MATFEPVWGMVLVQPIVDDTEMVNGLYVPDSAKEKPSEGIALAGKLPEGVALGDRVTYRKFSGTEIVIGGASHLLLDASDILGVWRD